MQQDFGHYVDHGSLFDSMQKPDHVLGLAGSIIDKKAEAACHGCRARQVALSVEDGHDAAY